MTSDSIFYKSHTRGKWSVNANTSDDSIVPINLESEYLCQRSVLPLNMLCYRKYVYYTFSSLSLLFFLLSSCDLCFLWLFLFCCFLCWIRTKKFQWIKKLPKYNAFNKGREYGAISKVLSIFQMSNNVYQALKLL